MNLSAKEYCIGIDSGSTLCKTVLFDGKKILDTHVVKTTWNPKLSAQESLGFFLEKYSLSPDQVCVSATGYGREAIDCAEYVFTEITCHAWGGAYLDARVQGIVDIGGQDSKVIHLKEGQLVDFLMNDKCAAGTGRFLNMACDVLEVKLEDIDSFVHPSESIPLNGMCAVFAESEIIGLLSAQKERSKILAGVLQSIAQKICYMTGKIDYSEHAPLLMTGGLSQSEAVRKAISSVTGLEVITHRHAPCAGALGACIGAYKS